MIRVDVKQGSPEWIQARLGLPTASQFHRLITPKTMKPSSAADGYLRELLAEQMLGESVSDASSEFMVRGTSLEASAVQFYQLQRDVDVETVGLLLRDDRKVGCSPDRLVGEDGGLEIKCPSAAVHVGYMLDGFDAEHRCQVQGCLWITGRQWWDLLSYNPFLPPVLVRMERDEEFIGKLEEVVDRFLMAFREAREKLIARGYLVEEQELALV